MAENQVQNGLERKLGLFSVTNIVIANMIGAGIFTTSGLLMADLRNPLIMIGLWIVGGVVALCGALCYGELGAAMPRAGGEYVFLSRLYRPSLGFLSGWVSFFAGFSAPIAASAIGFAAYLTRAFPQTLPFEEGTTHKIYAILLIMVFTGIHLKGIEFGAKVQNYLTLLKVGLIVVLVLAGFSIGKGNTAHLFQGEEFIFDFGGWKSLGLSLMWIMFAYSGWNAAAYIGSEIKNPVRNLPRSLILGTGIVMLLYLLLNLFYVYAIPPAEMNGVLSIAGLAVGNLFGQTFDSLLSIFISFALFSSLSAYIILGPRVYFSMARDGSFFRFASDIHPRFGVPHKSILLQGAVAAVMVLLGRFDQILTYMGFSLGIFPILAVVGIFKLRRKDSNTFRLPGYPLVPIVYILAGLLILGLSLFERPLESGIAIIMVLIGIPVYRLFKYLYAAGK
jgi:APA family basic amino acid/polyamine antiporter